MEIPDASPRGWASISPGRDGSGMPEEVQKLDEVRLRDSRKLLGQTAWESDVLPGGQRRGQKPGSPEPPASQRVTGTSEAPWQEATGGRPRGRGCPRPPHHREPSPAANGGRLRGAGPGSAVARRAPRRSRCFPQMEFWCELPAGRRGPPRPGTSTLALALASAGLLLLLLRPLGKARPRPSPDPLRSGLHF